MVRVSLKLTEISPTLAMVDSPVWKGWKKWKETLQTQSVCQDKTQAPNYLPTKAGDWKITEFSKTVASITS